MAGGGRRRERRRGRLGEGRSPGGGRRLRAERTGRPLRRSAGGRGQGRSRPKPGAARSFAGAATGPGWPRPPRTATRSSSGERRILVVRYAQEPDPAGEAGQGDGGRLSRPGCPASGGSSTGPRGGDRASRFTGVWRGARAGTFTSSEATRRALGAAWGLRGWGSKDREGGEDRGGGTEQARSTDRS